MQAIKNAAIRLVCITVLSGAICHLTSRIASAEFLSASSGGYGAQVQVGVTLLSADLLSVTPSQISSQSGPSNYNSSSGLVDLNMNSAIGIPPITQLSLATVDGVAQSSSFGNFSPNLSNNNVIGTGGVAELSLGIGRVAVLGSGDYAVAINAAALNSTTSIYGTDVDVAMEGFSTFESLSISVLGTPLNLASFGTVVGQSISFAPNTFIGLDAFGLANAGLYLNEQVKNFDEIGNFNMVTNALRLDLDAVSLGGTVGLINGEVVLGHSNATVLADMATVPEPGSLLAICAAGATMYGFRKRKRNLNVQPSHPDDENSIAV